MSILKIEMPSRDPDLFVPDPRTRLAGTIYTTPADALGGVPYRVDMRLLPLGEQAETTTALGYTTKSGWDVLLAPHLRLVEGFVDPLMLMVMTVFPLRSGQVMIFPGPPEVFTGGWVPSRPDGWPADVLPVNTKVWGFERDPRNRLGLFVVSGWFLADVDDPEYEHIHVWCILPADAPKIRGHRGGAFLACLNVYDLVPVRS